MIERVAQALGQRLAAGNVEDRQEILEAVSHRQMPEVAHPDLIGSVNDQQIKAFFGNSENALTAQIWIAVSVYVLVVIVRHRLNLSRSLYKVLPIRSLAVFDKTPLDVTLTLEPRPTEWPTHGSQLVPLN